MSSVPSPSPAQAHRVAFAAVFDEEARPHDEVLHAAADIAPADHVLDIGCGTGQSTRIAARAARDGSVLGVDVSAPLIEHARLLSAEEGLRNIAFEQADASTYALSPERFDVCISRFGSMFFPDPHAAFVNIARGMRRGGRIALLVWQAERENDWSVAIRKALLSAAAPDPQPFSLAEPQTVREILGSAGFAGVAFVDIHAPVRYGPDAATACDFVLGFAEPKRAVPELDASTAQAACERLRSVLAEHETPDGVLFDSRAWVITAHRER